MDNIDLIDRGVCEKNVGPCGKLRVSDWLSDVQNITNPNQIVEVRFKNTRKDFFRNVNNLSLIQGDIVAVEASPGHDIGIVSLTGDLVYEQMYKHKATYLNGDLRKVYRKAKPADIDKWKEAIMLEQETMIKSRQIAADLNLDMKIGDVEYQGDKTKAIFYYIADERVDFRSLIKILAEEFRIRIEMKQIGARQEAARIGGIGPCGRELCCSSWITGFVSVTTNSARYQDLTMNPQKLAGQCSKLKCCLNYEVDTYLDAQRDFPPSQIPLKTGNGNYLFQKADILGGVYWYAQQDEVASLVPVTVDNVREIQRLNKLGKMPDRLSSDAKPVGANENESFQNMAGKENIDRFDKSSGRKRKKFSRKGPYRKNR